MIAIMRMLAAIALLLIAAQAPFAANAQQTGQNPRIALVIGNATYRDQALATTANDAGLVAQTLQAAGFDVVGARDLDGQSLRTAFRDFLDKASAAGPDMQAFVYLAGRGLQYDGDNYFVPVDAQINRDADVPIDALRISDFAHALAQMPGKARIIVLDAARANPYASQGAPLAPGLALVDPEPGELIAFNAAPGTLAGDEQGPYGVYGKTLAGAMRQGGVAVEEVFDQTRVTVNQLSQGALLPWSASKLAEPYYIFERAADAPAPAAAAPVANQQISGLPADAAYAAALQQDTIEGYQDYLAAYPHSAQAHRVRAILASLREASFWRRSVNANTAHAYWTYLRRYPRGPHVADARRRLAMISAAYEPPPDFQPMVYQDLPPPPPDENFYEAQPYYAFDAFGPPPPPPPPEYYHEYYYVEDDDWRDLPPPPPPPAVGFLPVLPIAIPLVAGAVAYQHYNAYNRNGIAPAGLPAFRPPPPAPPPLPRNISPVQPPHPIPVSAPGPAVGHVRPLPPIGAPAALGAKPPAGAPAVPQGSGKPPTGAPLAPAPGGQAPAAPPPSARPPTAAPGSATPPPGAPVTTPAGKPPGVVAPPSGGKPPTVAPVTPGVAPPTGVPATPPGGKAPAGTLNAPAPGKALPVPPPPAAPALSPLNTSPKPAPKALEPTPAQIHPLAPKSDVNPPVAAPAPANTPTGPIVHPSPPPAPVVHAPPPAPAVHAPPPPAPVVHAPPPAAPVVHAPPPPAPSFMHRRRRLRPSTRRRRRLRSSMRRRLRLRSSTRRRLRLRSSMRRRRRLPWSTPRRHSRSFVRRRQPGIRQHAEPRVGCRARNSQHRPAARMLRHPSAGSRTSRGLGNLASGVPQAAFWPTGRIPFLCHFAETGNHAAFDHAGDFCVRV